MSVVSSNEWDEYATAHPSVHFLQTSEWGDVKSAFGWQPVRIISGNSGVQVLLRRLPFGFTVAYAPKVKIVGKLGTTPWLAELVQECRKRRSIFLKIEPDGWDQGSAESIMSAPAGLSVRASRNIQPQRTITVDLLGSEDHILERMKPKCRYNIKLATKREVEIRPWRDLSGFHKLMSETGARDEFGVHSYGYYARVFDRFGAKGNTELFGAFYGGRVLAALMVIAHGARSWYAYGASSSDERNRMPTYLLQWEAMRWAKSRGCTEYDLWGIPDLEEEDLESQFESRSDGLWGVYRFKRGFGGSVRRSAAALDIVLNPMLHRLLGTRIGG